MLVVSNTSPILNLATVGLLSLLKSQFNEVIVPQAVVDELQLQSDLPGNDDIRRAIESGWLAVRAVSNINAVQILRQTLDHGESEAIALALETKADLVLLDEKDARNASKDLGLLTTGVVGILLKAHMQGEVQKPIAILNRLRSEAGFYLSDKIMREVKKAVHLHDRA